MFKHIQWLEKVIEVASGNQNVVIFGCGSSGRRTLAFLVEKEVNVVAFSDNNSDKWGQVINDIKVVPPHELQTNYKNSLVIISSQWSKEINEQLNSLEVRNKLIFSYDDSVVSNLEPIEQVYNMLSDDDSRSAFEGVMLYRLTRNPDDLFVAPYQQYFHPHVQPVEHETVIDGGAFIGDTVKKFMDKQSGNLRIYSFEPCKDTFEKLTSFIKENQLGQVVTPIGEGLADKRNFAYLNKRNPKNPAGYRIVNNSSEVTEDIRINSLDNIVDEFQIKRIDLIKLDIEGSELVAILGAEQTIKKHAPKLQICLYHKPKDIFELPLLIEEMFKEHRYTYYFGHHHRGPWETVLYAIPAKR